MESEGDGKTDVGRQVEFQGRDTKYAVVIPVLNEGHTILAQLKRMQTSKCPADVVLCDGGSQDGSMELTRLSELGVRTLLVVEQRGLGAALRMGISYALKQGYAGVITIDGNGKDGVQAVAAFVERLDAGYDLVQGSRFAPGGQCANTPLDRYLGIRCLLAPVMGLASGFKYSDPTNGFKGMSRSLLSDPRMGLMREELNGFNFQFYLNYRTPKLGFRVTELPVSRVYPKTGPTPTKIVGLRQRMKLMKEFFKTIVGDYNVSAAQGESEA